MKSAKRILHFIVSSQKIMYTGVRKNSTGDSFAGGDKINFEKKQLKQTITA